MRVVKIINISFAFVLLSCVLFCNVVFATSTGFETQPVDAERVNSILSNIKIMKIDIEPVPDSIEVFDVNNNGIIAIGSSNSTTKTVCIYSQKDGFLYGYNFYTEGSFGVEISNNNVLNIFFVRSDIAVAIDPNNGVIDVTEIKNTVGNNSYWNYTVRANEKEVGDTKYELRNDMLFLDLFASSYSQLYRIDSTGEEILIYDVNSYQFIKYAVSFLGIVIFVCVAIIVIIKNIKKSTNNT